MQAEADSSPLSHEGALDAATHEGGLSIGAVAARLGVAPETVRSWGRRYGLTPSARTTGGHRRFARQDVDRLARMQRLVTEGLAPAVAARQVLADSDGVPTAATTEPLDHDPGRGGPGGRVLAVPGASRQARGLARAASRLDSDGMERILDRLLLEQGAIATWDGVMRPVLVAAGERWMVSGASIEIEHMLSQSVMASCLRYRQLQSPVRPGRPVLLGCHADDLHVLPLYVLGAALAEQGVPARLLGARVPLAAVIAASRRTGASAVFLWRQIAIGARTPAIALPPSRPPTRLVVGGPGWVGAKLNSGTVVAESLREAVDLLRAAATT